MQDLSQIRKKLDRIDEQIATLYLERLALCEDVAIYKDRNNLPILDEERENKKLDSVSGYADTDFEKDALLELYKQIMSISRRYQYSLSKKITNHIDFKKIDKIFLEEKDKVVYQGEEGAYSHIASKAYFGEDTFLYNINSFEEAILEVERESAKYAVIPIENSYAGAVVDTYDLLMKHDIYIVAEHMQKIEHALLGNKSADIQDIRNIYSHTQALMQCNDYLAKHPTWKQISFYNTAMAAKKISEENNICDAAIASAMAADIYGLKILDSNINCSSNNTTRFIIVSKNRIYKEGANKISIVFELKHKIGELYNIIGHIIFNKINMLNIESRPIKDKNWEYRFFIDIEGSLENDNIKNAIDIISKEVLNFKILGNY